MEKIINKIYIALCILTLNLSCNLELKSESDKGDNPSENENQSNEDSRESKEIQDKNITSFEIEEVGDNEYENDSKETSKDEEQIEVTEEGGESFIRDEKPSLYNNNYLFLSLVADTYNHINLKLRDDNQKQEWYSGIEGTKVSNTELSINYYVDYDSQIGVARCSSDHTCDFEELCAVSEPTREVESIPFALFTPLSSTKSVFALLKDSEFNFDYVKMWIAPEELQEILNISNVLSPKVVVFEKWIPNSPKRQQVKLCWRSGVTNDECRAFKMDEICSLYDEGLWWEPACFDYSKCSQKYAIDVAQCNSPLTDPFN